MRLTSLSASLRPVLRRDVLAICAVTFLADIVMGILMSTFSLFAEDLGASVVFIGILTTLTGLTSLVTSMPLGVLSDRIGRAPVLAIGLGGLTVTMLTFAAAPGPFFLLPGRLILGLSLVATFWIAAAYLGDRVSDRERGVAFGLMTTAMGIGFAVGPLVGSRLIEAFSIRAAYLFAASAGALAVVVILTVIAPTARIDRSATAPRPSMRESFQVARDRNLLGVSLCSILVGGIGFGGAVATFFPLHSSDLGVTDAAIGTMFAVRAVVSTIVRLPSGVLAGKIGSRGVILGAMAIDIVALIGIGMSQTTAMLTLWVAMEGIAFGAFLPSSQAFVAAQTGPETRGAAIGFYSMASGIGHTLGPVGLGVIASLFGLEAVFFVGGGLMVAGLLAIAILWYGPQPAAVVESLNEPLA